MSHITGIRFRTGTHCVQIKVDIGNGPNNLRILHFQLWLSVSIDAKTTTEVMDLSTYSARECRLINRCKGHTSVFICVITDQVVSCSTMTAGVTSDLVLMDMTTNIHV